MVHVAGSLFERKEPADFFPHVMALKSVIINIVRRAFHCDAHFDFEVNVFFRISGTCCIGLNEEQKNSIERSALRIDSNI